MDYNGINAKVSGMFGRLMSRSDYEALSRLQSVEEIGLFLRTCPAYTTALEHSELRRGPIERKLILSLYGDFHRIHGFISDAKLRKFLARYSLKNEIYVLKRLLCMAYDERDLSQDVTAVNSLGSRSLHFDFNKLLTARNVPELIEGLKGTEFYPVLSRVYDENRSLFELEIQLDLYYYMQLRDSAAECLDKANDQLIREILGVEVDLHNIIWIYRLKTWYQVDRNLIYTYLVPSIHKLTRAHINTLVNAETHDGLMAAMVSGPYGRGFSGDLRPEDACDAEVSRLYASARRKHPQTLASTLAYLYFKEQEIRNLISLLEGVRYSLKPEEIMTYVTSYYGKRER